MNLSIVPIVLIRSFSRRPSLLFLGQLAMWVCRSPRKETERTLLLCTYLVPKTNGRLPSIVLFRLWWWARRPPPLAHGLKQRHVLMSIDSQKRML